MLRYPAPQPRPLRVTSATPTSLSALLIPEAVSAEPGTTEQPLIIGVGTAGPRMGALRDESEGADQIASDQSAPGHAGDADRVLSRLASLLSSAFQDAPQLHNGSASVNASASSDEGAGGAWGAGDAGKSEDGVAGRRLLQLVRAM